MPCPPRYGEGGKLARGLRSSYLGPNSGAETGESHREEGTPALHRRSQIGPRSRAFLGDPVSAGGNAVLTKIQAVRHTGAFSYVLPPPLKE